MPCPPNFSQSIALCKTLGIFPPLEFLNVAILFIFTLSLVILKLIFRRCKLQQNCHLYIIKISIVVAKELISTIIPNLHIEDTGQQALNWMEMFRVSHLPIVDSENELLALISDRDIYDHNLVDCSFEKHSLSTQRPFVFENKHVFDACVLVHQFKLTTIPVLDLHKKYIGSISIQDLTMAISKMLAEQTVGGIIELEMNEFDYSLSQISQIVESNDAKILNLYIKTIPGTREIIVTLKVDKVDLSPIIQTFVRYDYNIKNVFMDDSLLNNMYDDRFDQFMNYLNM
ncbi:CBS domain-containing protein [Prolixibacteraceae bacterium JC049]|nr:CBS domain-containing protein [Prolixibacteraceae bacterium JC049]